MEFFNSAIEVLQTLVVALGAGLGVWGAINLLEGCLLYTSTEHRNNITFIISNQYLCIHYAHLLTANIAIIFQLFIYSPRRIIFVISKNTRR